MKSFKVIFLITIHSLLINQSVYTTDSVITFFITEESPEQLVTKVHNERLVSKPLQQPSFIHGIEKDRSWLDQPGVDGIQASYLGYITTSDKNGQITFPRLQQSDTIHLLITPAIEPQFMISPSLIHHWITKTNQPAAFYEISRKKNKNLNTYYFDTKILDIPEKLEPNTLILFAHPEHIHVPIGISLNSYSTNFILPELHAKKFNTVKNSLYTLSIKQYFEQINTESKNNAPTIISMVINQ